MKNETVPIDQAGRIVLPKSVRQELAIKSGDTFKVSIQGVAVTLTPNKAGSKFVRKGKALVFTTASYEVLSEANVREMLDEGRKDHDSQSITGLLSRKARE